LTVDPGLSGPQVAESRAAHGVNRLPAPPRAHPALQLARQMLHLFALMLWVAAALAWLAGLPALAVAIALVVVVNGVFSFAQEFSADHATEQLGALLPVRTTVRRAGHPQVVEAADLVVGDVVILEPGDRVCADLVLAAGTGVSVDESLLTGESAPCTRGPGSTVFAGTYVVEGRGDAVVHHVGASTRLADLAAATLGAVRPPSPLAVELGRVIRIVGSLSVLVGVAFFLLTLLLGRDAQESFLFAIGVTVALVPEGLLPTVTLSLSRAARRMAHRNALVRRVEAVETLGSTTFICTDKTGTLTRNQMAVVRVWTPVGSVLVSGDGYAPEADLEGLPTALAAARVAADSAARCFPDATAVRRGDTWEPVGDPMAVAVRVLATRCGLPPPPPRHRTTPFDPRLRRSATTDVDGEHVLGAPDSVLGLCQDADGAARAAVGRMTDLGMRVVAVAARGVASGTAARGVASGTAARGVASGTAAPAPLRLLGLLGLEDPPREDVAEAIASCRLAGIRIAMVTGDHPGTARAIAKEVGLLRRDGSGALVVEGRDLPEDLTALGALLDRDEVVVARVTPEDKLRIAHALQARGHVVAMTGDGVNDGPALRAADIGIAMGASGTDVAREAADMVLLDDHFGSIVAAVELGRSTFTNIRKFLTYHLTDNVAELTPFLVWALSGGTIPLAITVLQVLALDIGTDLLPALALGAERPAPRTMVGPLRRRAVIDGALLRRAFGVLGPAEALTTMLAFVALLMVGGWTVGTAPGGALLAVASGTAFTAVVLGQMANAFACRSETRSVLGTGLLGNPLLLAAVGAELAMLVVFLGVPPVADLLGGTVPDALGWSLALAAVPAVWGADALHKRYRWRAARRGAVQVDAAASARRP
jgi:magnesium-transporting ATPase (P-type)